MVSGGSLGTDHGEWWESRYRPTMVSCRSLGTDRAW